MSYSASNSASWESAAFNALDRIHVELHVRRRELWRLRWALVSLLAGSLTSCFPAAPTRDQHDNKESRTNDVEVANQVQVHQPRATERPGRPVPAFIAVNELRRALLPLAPQMGQVLLRGRCVVFEARGAQATVLWPYGTRLQQRGERLAVHLPSGREILVPSRTTLGGAHVPLNSRNMTRFSQRLHPDCPNDVFAVSRFT